MTPKGIMNERAIEYSFVFKWLAKSGAKNVLDVGTGRTALPALIAACKIPVRCIDNSKKYIRENRYVKPIYDDILNPRIKPGFDFITCISVAEHIPDYKRAIDGMISLLNPRGYLVLTFPYNEKEYVENVYKLPNAGYGRNNKNICRQYSRENIDYIQKSMIIWDQEYWQIFTGPYWTVGKRLQVPIKTAPDKLHHLTCVVARKYHSVLH